MTPQEAMSLSPEERKDLMRDLFFHGGSEGKKLARQIQKEDEKQKIRDKNEEYKTLIKTQGIHP